MQEDDYTYENLKNFTYIDMIQKEVTRLWGPVPALFMREAQQDHYLGSIPVKKGTMVNLVQSNHYNAAYFKDPYRFRPERWESECKDLPPFIMGGFGYGSRSCIGKHLAYVETKVGLIKFLKRYNKIKLMKEEYKMIVKFCYESEPFECKMEIAK